MREPSLPPADAALILAYWSGYGSPLPLHLHLARPDRGLLRSQIFWEIGEEVSLSLALSEGPRQQVTARVIAILDDPPGMQLQFLSLTPQTRAALERHLARATEE